MVYLIAFQHSLVCVSTLFHKVFPVLETLMHRRHRLTLELILEVIQDGCNSTPCLALLILVGLSEAGCGCV